MVGIDPGTTVAFAIFDMDGKLIHVESEREMGKEELVKRISRFGKPCMLCCDVSHTQDLVLKLATIFNTRISTPAYNITEDEKKSLARNFPHSNEHERDAIASAVKAFHSYENRFRQVEKIAQEKNLSSKTNELKYLILNDIPLSMALLTFEEPQELSIRTAEKHTHPASKKPEISQIVQANIELRKSTERLTAENTSLKNRIKELENQSETRIRKDKLVRILELQILKLQELLKRKKQNRQAALKIMSSNKINERRISKNPDIEAMVDTYREERS